ncbi:MAG TPA: ABC transporter permease [Kofleriaceae bacterium]|nr:ABC transporter permease [Kofleriaceae bacterium]
MPPSSTRLLVRDELIGFARSKVMLVLWVVLPCIALLGFLTLGNHVLGGAGARMTATAFMSFLESSLAGTVAALMIAVDLVSERNRNVYVLLAIRPIRREAIVWAKLLAVFGCVTVACVVSLLLGIVVDLVRGHPPTADGLYDTARALVSMTAVVALSTAAGALFGVLARTILVAVILVLYVGQNVAIVPMLPAYLGVLPDRFWLFMVISAALAAIVSWLAGLAFRRLQL